jgi:hypothetical protein
MRGKNPAKQIFGFCQAKIFHKILIVRQNCLGLGELISVTNNFITS